MLDRRFWLTVAVATGVGVALRLYYVLGVVRDRIPLVGDSATYHFLGRHLADGEGYIRPAEFLDDGTRIPTAEFPPVYPTMLAVLDVVGVDSPTGQRIVGALLGGVTIVVIAVLGAAVAGRTVGMVAAGIAAVYPQLVVFDGSLLSEGPYTLFVATGLLAVVRSLQAGGSDRRRWWVLASVAIGLAVLTRSEALLFVPLLIVPAAHVPGDRRAWARAALVGSAGTLVLVGAWTVRNAVSLDHLQPLTNNSGTLVAGANCDAVYGGTQVGGWRLDCIPDIDRTDETAAAAELRAVGFEYMRDHAGEAPKVIAARVARTFGAWDIRTNLFFESLEGRDYDWLWAAWYAWIALVPLAILGAVDQRRASRILWPILVPFAVVLVTSIVSYGNQRFRMAAEPSVVVLAAIGAVAVARFVAGRLGPATATDASEPANAVDDQAQAPVGSS